jgi:hypothetical protein
MSRQRIRTAFETRLDAWASSQGLPFIPENTEADKPPQFIRGILLPAPTVSQDLTGAHKRYIGIYQVDLCMAKGEGPADSDALVTSLEAQFPGSSYIAEAGLRILILEPVSATQGKPDDTHYVTHCSILYRADTVS